MNNPGFFASLRARLSRWNHARLHALARRRLQDRKARLAAFGTHAIGLAVHTEQGDFIVNPADNGVSRRLLQQGRYGREEIELAAAFLGPQAACVVVGSHIGAIVVPLARHCQSMIVVEASPENYRYLALNLRLNDCRNVTALNFAANDVAGALEFLLSEDNSGGSKRLPKVAGAGYYYDQPRVVQVPARPLDVLLAGAAGAGDIDLLFMDIEGSEYFALKGAQATLARTRVLIVEWIPHHLHNVAGVTVAEFWAQLAPHFARLRVPRSGAEFAGAAAIHAELQRLVDAGESHENIVFLRA